MRNPPTEAQLCEDHGLPFCAECAAMPANNEPTEAMIAKGAHVLSEWLNDNAPINEHIYRQPATAAFKAMDAIRPTPTSVPAEGLVERLRKGVTAIGLHDDNNTELFDIEDANEVMWKAAKALAALSASNTPASGLADMLHDICSTAYTRGYREGCEDSGAEVDTTAHGDGVSQYLIDESGSREVLLAALRSTPAPDALRSAAEQALAVIEAAPELNLSNYSVDEVEALNNATIEAWQILKPALRNEDTPDGG